MAVVKLNVKEYANDEAKIYDNRVIEIEELTVVDRESQQSADSTSSAVSSKYIIAKFREFVKNNDEKKSLTNSDIKNSTEQYDLDPEAVKEQKKNNEKRSEKLEKENEELKAKLKKERSLREKMAREDANAAKAAGVLFLQSNRQH